MHDRILNYTPQKSSRTIGIAYGPIPLRYMKAYFVRQIITEINAFGENEDI